VTGPLATRRQPRRRRITPNTNTTTTTMISTHNHVDMAASLVGAGAIQADATAAHPSKQLGHRQATSRARIDGRAPRRLAGTPAPCEMPADLGWPGGYQPARPGQAMSTATRVPETHELEGEDALSALRRTAGAGWLRTRSSASAPLTACGSRSPSLSLLGRGFTAPARRSRAVPDAPLASAYSGGDQTQSGQHAERDAGPSSA
jgi:hypothetical protein